MRAPVIPAFWPYRDASRHIACKPHLWHVQDIGAGPLVLLLHGAGGATQSFRHLIPLLAQHYRIIALDLPGQGFSVLGARARCGLDPLSDDIEGWLFPVMAKALALTPFVPSLFSKLAGTQTQVRQLIATTGSTLDEAGQALYLYLMQKPAHVSATLAMMAQWNLTPFLRRMTNQTTPTLLITASNDRAVPASVSERAAQVMPDATWLDIPDYGHLVHEEAADLVAAPILAFLARFTASGEA